MRKVKLLHPDSKLPSKKYIHDAGFDHYLIQDIVVPAKSFVRFPLGIAVEIKADEFLTIRSRSSMKMKGLSSADTTCDSFYTGELFGFLINHSEQDINLKKGERAVQLVFQKIPTHEELVAIEPEEKLPQKERGNAGFGSTGKN